MVTIKSKEEIEILREGGKRLAAILSRVAEAVRPGVPSLELDALARRMVAEGGDSPSFLNYQAKRDKKKFPAALCVSVNDEIVHGLPSGEKILQEGDIVGIDLGLRHNGLCTDAALTLAVGAIDEQSRKLLEVTKQALTCAIERAHAGATIGDIGYVVESFVKAQGAFGIVRDLAGHGVGYEVHEEPFVPNYGKQGGGIKLEAGMVLALEPMLTLGSEKIVLSADGFAYRTKDGSRSAHFEHTVVITEKGAEVLTKI
ncbi:MAG: methionyl aminopeptidase [Parcubacteria group bacterium Gr01-1014_17]|nr:MAG: methionyl aminopeptidase [Parcubacteria group bacterium Gr01-1014_17]